jgi:very-short-patch-repair endonuclease
MAALLSLPGSALSHRSAARLWGLTFASSEHIEITVPPELEQPRENVDLHTSEQLEPFVLSQPMRATNVARTLTDLSADLTQKQLGAVVDQACNKNLVKLHEIQHCLDVMITKGRSRISYMREVLAARSITDERLDSFLERRNLAWIRKAQLPEPKTQYPVLANGIRYRLDIAYPELKIAIEPDGPHHLLPSIAAYDRRRDADLALLGWVVFHTYLETEESEVTSFLRRAISQRSALSPIQ